jgi:putative DNA primase/helicase
MWKDADPAGVEGHAYLERKHISIARGLRLYSAMDGTALLAVPMWAFDMNGTPQLTSLQLIDGNGQKRFLKAGRVEGTFFSLKGDTSIIIICEGVATGFSIWEATGLSVVCAFNSGNLIEVAKEFARHRPLAKIMIAGDDDAIASESWVESNRQLEDEGKSPKPWTNVGRKKAEAAAKAIGCRWILPLFSDGPARSRTDFNDLHLIEGLEAVGAQVMGAFRSVDAEDTAPGAEIVEIDRLQDESWRSKIPVTSQSSPDGGNVEGVALYIANHKLLKGRIRFNTFTKEMELDGNPIEDYQVAEFRRLMHADRFKARKPDVLDEMVAEGRRNQYDPLLHYLQSLTWDQTPRMETWLTDYLGTTDTPYARAVGRKFLIGAAARALNAGVKMDTMLVLEGDQGIGKSTALRYLFGDRFFIDHLPDFHSKDSFMQLQGAWCVEVAELSALSKADVKDVKQFLSRLVDKFRPPYGSATIQVGRRCVFAGTVNPEEESGYLRDPTGARRFWPVSCGEIDLPALLEWKHQLWAEAVAAYKSGEPWYLTDAEEIGAAKAEQEARREIDPWE